MMEHIQNKTLTVKHCPIEEMLANYFTKPLQGTQFVKLQNYIMGADDANGDCHSPRSVSDGYAQHSE